MDRYKKVERWLKANARELEQAQYDVLFDQGDSAKYLNAIKAYQTTAKGFGRGIEPDSLNPNPSPIQTWWTIHYLRDLPDELSRPLHEDIMEYLTASLTPSGVYPATIPSNNDYPHAVWWHYSEATAVWGYNPSVALWAYMVQQQPDHIVKPYLLAALDDFIQTPRREMHELKCFVDAYEWLQPVHDQIPHYQAFGERLMDVVLDELKNYDPKATDYQATPLSFCDHPNHSLYPVLSPFIHQQLTHLTDILTTEVIWPVHFHWQQFETDYQTAKTAWMGIQAIQYLRFLTRNPH